MKNRSKHFVRWLVWGLAATFFFYEFVIRVAPSVMISELMKAFAINAAGVGNLSAFYLYAYSPMQLPVGLLTDHYGARKLLTFASLVCGIGCILFAFAVEFWTAAVGRLLMGFGSAFAFVGLVYISSHWFPKNKLALLVGIGNSIGMLGAIVGQGPTSFAVQNLDWRGTYLTYGIIGIAIAFIIYFLIRNSPSASVENEEEKGVKTHIFHYLKVVTKNKHSWINAIGCFLFYATTVAFAGLWGPEFLETVQGMKPNIASFGISMIFLGWIIGGPLVGKYSDMIEKRKPFLLIFSLLAFFSLLPVIYIENMNSVLVYILLFLVGFFSSAEILHFSIAIELVSPNSKGTAIAFTNFMTMIGGSFLQPFIGYLLDLHWSGQTVNGVPMYSPDDWKFAMTCFPIAFLLCFFCNLFLKEKRYEETPKVSF